MGSSQKDKYRIPPEVKLYYTRCRCQRLIHSQEESDEAEDKDEEGEVPWTMLVKTDALVFEERDECECQSATNEVLYGDRERARNLFSRHLESYPNGSHVGKHCQPWGRFEMLRNEIFTLKQKSFDWRGQMVGALLETDSGAIFSIGSDYLFGWTSDAQMNERFSYHK